MDLKSFVVLFFLIGCGVEGNILPSGPVDVVLGRNVTLQTVVGNLGTDFIVITWSYSDGHDLDPIATATPTGMKNVNDRYVGRVTINVTNGYLTLSALRAEDSGDYSISIIPQSFTPLTGEIKVRVLEPVSDVLIKSSVPEAVELNDTVTLTCSAKGSFLKFTWINGSVPLKVDGRRITAKEEELKSVLTIYNVLRSDLIGPIFCSAANKLETEKSAPFNLTVHYGPDEVKISPSKPAQYIRAHSDFNLTCSAVSSPAPSFLWFYNEEQVKTEGRILSLNIIEKLGYGKKEGQYTCSASNDKTKRSVRSAPVTFGIMEPISGAKLVGPTSVLIAGNSSANLSCSAESGAVKTRAWLKNGKPLSAGGRVTFSGDMSSVAVAPVQKEDNGKYTCQLINPVNTEQAVFNMVVHYGPETPVVEGRDAVEVEDLVTLVCSALSSPPANYTWKFNGTLTKEQSNTFTIDRAVYSDSGTYTCEASNAITGKKSASTHTLSVKEELVEGLSDGAIAGIVIGVLVALAAAIAVVFYCRQKVPVESPY
ncbi:carcinoembryonic antigen-related cell adhesion molecule 5 [Gouania willdenowi]|uniref:Carcinoembryonic antigen-related cell adhesion molecule 5-like n=1 Tax=Gouania willdenowi TaxID=441366 RepID=A0A8C5HR40_GOUWI|nr:carcinoembryonic antigen-related cell adhesion molecule 5-like [Gouania willdenowi]